MSDENEWVAGPERPEAAAKEVHVWRAQLSCDAKTLWRYEETLSAAERTRADGFRFPGHRERFVAGRGILRELLGRYIPCRAAELSIGYKERGKPFLAHPNDTGIEFNVAHSENLALIGVSLQRAVGVDVEALQEDISGEKIVERYFSAEELAELHALPEATRPEAFFLGWTRKEAYLKALGDGLHVPLTSFRVTLTPAKPAKLESDDSARWTLRSLTPGEGFAGAVVGEGKNWDLRCFDWRG